jgi:hypothetical protein
MKHYKVVLTPREDAPDEVPVTWSGEAVCLMDALYLARRTVWPEQRSAQVVEE